MVKAASSIAYLYILKLIMKLVLTKFLIKVSCYVSSQSNLKKICLKLASFYCGVRCFKLYLNTF